MGGGGCVDHRIEQRAEFLVLPAIGRDALCFLWAGGQIDFHLGAPRLRQFSSHTGLQIGFCHGKLAHFTTLNGLISDRPSMTARNFSLPLESLDMTVATGMRRTLATSS